MSWTYIFLIIIIILVFIIFLLVFVPNFYKIIKFFFFKQEYKKLSVSSKIRLIYSLNEAITELSKNKIGALITIVNKQNLDDFRTDGIQINADISPQLILAIFHKKSPLHDGALILLRNKMQYAGTYYKISNKSINNKYGARHRAALGISEQTDALTIVVSEETGDVSFVVAGIITKIKLEHFQEKISILLREKEILK